jgi:hypothetical protein
MSTAPQTPHDRFRHWAKTMIAHHGSATPRQDTQATRELY